MTGGFWISRSPGKTAKLKEIIFHVSLPAWILLNFHMDFVVELLVTAIFSGVSALFGDQQEQLCFCPFSRCLGVEDVFNALKTEMQQITSREEVGAVETQFSLGFGGCRISFE